MTEDQIVVSTDGSALGNPNGPMGWGWVDHQGGGQDAGGATNGTNQIGELCAVLQALRAHPGSMPLTIQTDSQYAINCSTKWVAGWRKKGWRNAAGKPVKNRALIEAIDQELRQRQGPVRFFWVKGHAGERFNEQVDDLARGYASAARAGTKRSYLPLEGWQSLLASPYTKGLKISEEVRLQLKGQGVAPPTSAVSAGSGQLPTDEAEVAGDDDRPERPMPIQQPLDAQTDLPDETEILDDEARTEIIEPVGGAAGQAEIQESDDDQAETGEDEAGEGTESAEPARGLTASGDLTITPPPSSSPYFADKALHVSGSITFEADIDQKGRVHISAPFRLHSITERDTGDGGEQLDSPQF
ncbi:ribonuclease HI [Bifidobacterium actinocoloniiforme DSM 22766]|uniref:ribonuclease H n=1 Tax=Bifidobacterium actinocoloniiforme DSM 22766 TaxID=1437605 RepID=A0A086Z1U3_9BIFI|nr:ribonuclease H [Bifidobacterium actinocoloniiforme]KFI40493.1 ribonuclease HI [Bifidobacterium actinocoloniiforme DSM 22766]